MMKQRKLKRLLGFLSFALIVVTVCSLTVGYFTANAAVSSYTITFGANGNWEDYFTATDEITTKTGTSGYSNGATGATTTGVPRTTFTCPANNSDVNIIFDLQKPTTGKQELSLKANDVIYVQYTTTDLTVSTKSCKVYLFKADGTYVTADLMSYANKQEYNTGGNMRDAYATVPSAGTYTKIRLDIPNSGANSATYNVYIGKIYAGPASGTGLGYTVTFDTDGGTAIAQRTRYYNSTVGSVSNPTKTADGYKFTFAGWRVGNKTEGDLYTSAELAQKVVTGNMTVYAIYETQVRATFEYRILNSNNENVKTTKDVWVKAGSKPTAPTVDDPISNTAGNARYDFTGWSPAVGNISAPKKYVAQYTVQYYIKYTYRTAFDTVVTDTEWVNENGYPNGKNVLPTVANDADNSRYHFVDWGGVTMDTIKATQVTKSKTYTAAYYQDFLLTYKYRGAFTSTSNDQKIQEWVIKNEYPQRASDPATLKNGDQNQRIRFLHWGSNVTTETIQTTPVTAAKTYNAVYSATEYRIRFKWRNASYVNGYHNEQWLTAGKTPTTPTVPASVYHNADQLAKWVYQTSYGWDKPIVAVTGAADYVAEQKLQYRVRFFVGGSTTAKKTVWVETGTNVTTDSMTATQRNHTTDTTVNFVCWLDGSETGAPVDLSTQRITAARDYYAKYLSKTFTGSEYVYDPTKGSETPGIVATRKVECTNTTNQTYRITTEIYTYGISDGYFDIMESVDGNFILSGATPGHSMTVYRVPYSGNGKWGTAEEIGNTGGNGYVAVNLDPSGTNKIYNPDSGAASTGYWQLRWLNNSYTDENGKNFNINYFRTQAGLTEVSRGDAVTAPYGYKLRIVVTCKLDRDSIIGGNNVLISTPDYTYVNYIHGSDSTKNKSYPWSSKDEAITASEPKTNNDLVNVNVPIQYDFCVHDYYMDLYDVKKTHKTAANKVQQMLDKDKKQITETYVGLISVLRNAAAGNNGINNRAVYQYLFTHGNEPIFSWENRGKYSGTDTLYYNTDCDGVHNKYVNIQYKVVHEDARTVYETHCFVGNKSDDPTTESGANFSVKNNHNEAAVDFTKDHKVTVTTTVTSSTTGVKDSFGNAVISNFSRSAESYFFAPRFVVADYSTTAYTSVQRESRIYDATFNTYKSAVDGAKASTLTARTYGASAPALIYNHSDKDACDRIYYSFTTDYTHALHPTTQRMINGVESVTFTTKVINVPKRMDSSEVNGTAPRKTIVRNFYVIPANVIAFDEGAITFYSDSEGNGVWNLTGDYKDPYQTSDADTRETEGANTTKTGVSYPANSIHGNNNAFLARTEMDYVGQSRVTTVDGSYTKDSAGNQVRANQERYGIFTFTGTGFDIISRTGRNTGVLVAAVYKGELTEEQCKNATPVQNILVDTYLDSDTLYQIPVIKYELKNANGERTHGTYTVYFRAYYHEIFDHNLNLTKRAPVTEAQICELLGWDPAVPSTILLAESGDTRPATRTDGKNSYDVYVDGIRVYNTLGTLKEAPASVTNIYSNTDSAAKYAAYAVYNCGSILSENKNLDHFVGPEVNPVFYNVSDLLVDSGKTDWVGSLTGSNAVNGILYIAAPMPDGYVDDNGGQTGNNSGSGDGLIHSGFHLGMSGVLYTETVNGKNYVYRMADTNDDGTPDTKERVKHNGQDVYYLVENGKTVYYAGSTKLSDAQFFAACDQTVCYYDAKYDSIGPEHEIYLKKNSGIAMDIAGGSKAMTVHVGLRSLDGTAITVKVWDGTAWVNLCENLKTRTETYFDATTAVKGASGKLYLKVTAGNYASIVNIKAVGGSTPSVSYRTIMDALEIFKAEAETPLVDEGMKISHSLNLAADISMNYAVPATALEGAESSYMTVELPVYEGNALVGSKFVTLEPVQQGYYYYYTLNGLTAVNMNDELKAELHYLRDGRNYVSVTDHYSIARYAYIQLAKEAIAPGLQTLCAELLRYGSYAQIFKGYRTDALADSQMTEAHRALLRDLSGVTFGSNNAVLEDLEAPAVRWNGKALDLGSKVAVKFVFGLSDYEGRVEDLTLSVTYTAIDGTEKTAVVTGPQVYNQAHSLYVFTFDGLLAAELRSVLYVRVCENGTPISQTMVYSPDTYGNGKTDTLGELCKALFAYSDAAKDYFLQ